MTPVDLIREKLESCFIFCSYAAPEIRHELGVRHLGQVWTKTPAWYFWLDGTNGAFMLELQGGAQFNTNGTDCKGAAGIIRYFPPPDCTGTLSSDEALLLDSGAFDATNTPQWERLAEIIGTDRFVIATIELHAAVDGDDLFFVLETTRHDLDGAVAEKLFDKLVGMQAYAAQCVPSGPFIWGRHGRAAAIGSSGNGERFLRSYLETEHFLTVTACDPTLKAWSALSVREPVAAEGTGCCCCCH